MIWGYLCPPHCTVSPSCRPPPISPLTRARPLLVHLWQRFQGSGGGREEARPAGRYMGRYIAPAMPWAPSSCWQPLRTGSGVSEGGTGKGASALLPCHRRPGLPQSAPMVSSRGLHVFQNGGTSPTRRRQETRGADRRRLVPPREAQSCRCRAQLGARAAEAGSRWGRLEAGPAAVRAGPGQAAAPGTVPAAAGSPRGAA